MSDYLKLTGKVVLITGGATGIGASLVRQFSAHQAQVYFCDINAAAGELLAAEMGPEVQFHHVDLIRERQVIGWVREVARREGAVHVLINNAAVDTRIPLADTTAADWDQMFARNLRAYFFTAREAMPHMPPGSAIINFSSVTFHNAPAQMTAYVATKAGIQGLTRALARELGPRRIRVNTISPGWIMTERQLRQFVTPAVKRLIKRSQCIPDLIQPEAIAQVALFLASEASAAITGQELLADRGWAFS